MKFDKDAGVLLKRVLKEWIESHSEGGVMSEEVVELWGELWSSIDRKVMWYEGMPKEEGGVLDFKWFGERVLSDWCGVCGEVDRLMLEIMGKVISEEEKGDTEEVFDEISVCGRCKYNWRLEGNEAMESCGMKFGGKHNMFDKSGRCLVFKEKE